MMDILEANRKRMAALHAQLLAVLRSDWKAGTISEQEFRSLHRQEVTRIENAGLVDEVLYVMGVSDEKVEVSDE